MAKAREIKTPDCSAEAFEWAAEVLRVRFEEVLSWREAALAAENVKGVHDMRVATRRLRSVLRDFSSLAETDSSEHLKKDLKELADALGAVRNEDVTILALEKLRAKATSEKIKHGLSHLIKQRRDERERAQTGLTQTLTDDHFDELETCLTKTIKELLRQKKDAEKITIRETSRRVIPARLDRFNELSANIYAAFATRKLHKLRLAAKHLRDALELFAACREKRTLPFAKEIAKLQTFLGEVHDADVWIKNLGKRLQENESFETELWLLSKFVKTRTKNYRRALELWSKWKTEGFFENLCKLIL